MCGAAAAADAYDVVVVGGGIAGVSVAYELALDHTMLLHDRHWQRVLRFMVLRLRGNGPTSWRLTRLTSSIEPTNRPCNTPAYREVHTPAAGASSR